jgi:hypothetical protein
VGVAKDGDCSHGVNGYVMITISPVTDKSCRCFGLHTRYRLESEVITTQLRDGANGVYSRNPDGKLSSPNVDVGRQIRDRELEAEGAARIRGRRLLMPWCSSARRSSKQLRRPSPSGALFEPEKRVTVDAGAHLDVPIQIVTQVDPRSYSIHCVGPDGPT